MRPWQQRKVSPRRIGGFAQAGKHQMQPSGGRDAGDRTARRSTSWQWTAEQGDHLSSVAQRHEGQRTLLIRRGEAGAVPVDSFRRPGGKHSWLSGSRAILSCVRNCLVPKLMAPPSARIVRTFPGRFRPIHCTYAPPARGAVDRKADSARERWHSVSRDASPNQRLTPQSVGLPPGSTRQPQEHSPSGRCKSWIVMERQAARGGGSEAA